MKLTKLKHWFFTTNQMFKLLKEHCFDYYDMDKRRIFINRGSKILLVAHLDTVHRAQYLGTEKNIVYGKGLDDRLGCWVAYKLAYQLNTDLLLTDLEESAASTIQYHNCNDYNLIVEFDRRGDDVVLYETGSQKLENALREFFPVGWGTFSDICFADTKTACVNIGIGYQREHSLNSWADLTVTNLQIKRFKAFLKKNRKKIFIRDKQHQSIYRGSLYNSYWGATTAKHEYIAVNEDLANCEFCNCIKTLDQLIEVEIYEEQYLVCVDCFNKPLIKDVASVIIHHRKKQKYCYHCNSMIDEGAESCPYCYNFIDF